MCCCAPACLGRCFHTPHQDATDTSRACACAYVPSQLSVNAVSAALATSPVPWNGPAAAVRVGWRDGAPYVGPSRREMAEGPLDLLYAGGRDKAVRSTPQLPHEESSTFLCVSVWLVGGESTATEYVCMDER